MLLALLLVAGAAGLRAEEAAWWNKEWTLRKKVTVDTAADGLNFKGDIGGQTVLVRLHEGNFQFAQAHEDGSDIRFVAGDGKTLLGFHLEKFDPLFGEGFAWVRVPEIKSGGQTSFWLYYGGSDKIPADGAADLKKSYDSDTVLDYHFSGQGAPVDFTGNGNDAKNGGLAAEGSLIGAGLRLDGKTTVGLPESDSLAWSEGGNLTWSVWFKAALLQDRGILFSRSENGKSVVIGLEKGVPFVEINGQKSGAGEAVAAESWHHLAVVFLGGKTELYLDGQPYGSVAAGLPALKSGAILGGGTVTAGTAGFIGEVDELVISNVARLEGYVGFQAASQGGEKASSLIQTTEDEASAAKSGGALGAALEHVSLFGDIASHMMFDGWMVIFFCVLMAGTGWTVAIRKLLYLNKIQKGSDEFMRQWALVATDLTALDHSDAESVKSLGGQANSKIQRLMHQSPLYHIYHIGSEEIRHRIYSPHGFNGLSARSIQAVKASLHSGLTREVHRLNQGLIFLTISIAGGPYVGLLGTVMGVMITFAVIAKSGEVEVNSIAPGIASALLATVAGLLVAIPALFIYSFLNSRIKDVISNMQLFIDEFITKMAEFYPPTNESRTAASSYEQEQEEEAGVR
jgi:biopolymer transport protein ExbB